MEFMIGLFFFIWSIVGFLLAWSMLIRVFEQWK